MTLHHGEAINAESIERVCGREFCDEKFVSLCNSIIWTNSKCTESLLPSFTERVKVKDGGIDAEWWDCSVEPDQIENKNLIKPGWNVYQYKRRDVSSQPRPILFRAIKNDISRAIKTIFDRTGRRPNNFLLFTNLDLSHITEAVGGAEAQKGKLKEAIIEGYDQPETVNVEIVGAAELSVLLNELPFIRSAFFSESMFSSWETAWLSHNSEKEIFGVNIPLIGRNDEILKISKFIEDKKKKGLLLSGPHNIGKSRLILEATRKRYYDTIFCLDPKTITLKDITSLQTQNSEIVVILEDIEPSFAGELLKKVLSIDKIKIIVSTPNVTKIILPNFGSDDRISSEHIEPLGDDAALKLFRSTGVHVPFGIESWIEHQADGNPGILLIAGNQLLKNPYLFDKPEEFTEKIGQTFNKKIQSEFGESYITYFKVLSLLEYVIIDDDSKEINNICKTFDFKIKPDEIFEYQKELEATGFIRKRGNSSYELRPPIYANYLANTITRGRLTNILSLLTMLDSSGQTRLFKRLIQFENPQTHQLWEELFEKEGYFLNFENFQKDIDYLLILVHATPEKIAAILTKKIYAMSDSEQSIFFNSMDSKFLILIHNFIRHENTAKIGIKLLAKIANIGKNDNSIEAEKIFYECFKPFDYQNTLPLKTRLNFLSEMLSKQSPQNLRKIGINAVNSGLQIQGPQMLHPSRGSKPLRGMPLETWADIFNYLEELAKKILELSQDEDVIISEFSYNVVPSALSGFFNQLFFIHPENAIEKMASFCTDDKFHSGYLSIPKFYRMLKNSQERIDRELIKNTDFDWKKYQLLSNRLSTLMLQIKGDKEKLLQIILSGDEFESPRLFKKDLQKLALSCKITPAILSEKNFVWICSQESHYTFQFAYELGKIDYNLEFFDSIIKTGLRENGLRLFSGYFSGLSSWNLEFTSKLLDQLKRDGYPSIIGICQTSALVPEDSNSLDRIKSYISAGNIQPQQFIQFMNLEQWLQSEKSDDFIKFLEEIVERNDDNCSLLLRYFGSNQIHTLKNVNVRLINLIYHCLLMHPNKEVPQDEYIFDLLAAFCVKEKIGLGYKLLETRLLSESTNEWRPIGDNTNHEFWKVLYKADKRRSIYLALNCAIEKPHSYIVHDLLKITSIVEDESILIEFITDRQKADVLLGGIDPITPISLSLIQKIFEIFPPDKQRIDNLIHRIISPMSWSDKTYLSSLIQLNNEIEKMTKSTNISANTKKCFRYASEKIQEAIEKTKTDGEPMFKKFMFPKEENLFFKKWLEEKIRSKSGTT